LRQLGLLVLGGEPFLPEKNAHLSLDQSPNSMLSTN